MNAIKSKQFKDVDLSDSFFDSLKSDYPGFESWYLKKMQQGEYVYVLEENRIQGFLYLKEEHEKDETVNPILELRRRLKVGTFKVNAHGTKVGERFIKIIIDEMHKSNYEEAYVTIFDKHAGLIEILTKYGFKYYGEKTSAVGIEEVYIKYKNIINDDIYLDYPKINISENKKFLLSIYPKYHTRMFPDSKLETEKEHYIEDISHTNSIEKIYLSGAHNLSDYNKGDIVVIYRTKDSNSAKYSSVATSICVIEEIKHINDFNSLDEFLDYCVKYSVFTEEELRQFWSRKSYPYLIKMLYNIALDKRPIRKKLIEEAGLNENERWVALPLSDEEFLKILELGEVNENIIIN